MLIEITRAPITLSRNHGLITLTITTPHEQQAYLTSAAVDELVAGLLDLRRAPPIIRDDDKLRVEPHGRTVTLMGPS